MEIHFAPLQGYVDNAYRRLHREIYGGVDCYYTPFIRVEGSAPRRQDLARLSEAYDDGTPLVPQIIFGSFDEFRILAEAVKSLGYPRIDLNLGCPYPMQTRRGRGCSMISDTSTMYKVAEYISHDHDIAYSVKMRLGKDSADEWRELLPILNDIPLRHVTLHPRIGKQMYSGETDALQLRNFMETSTNPVIVNPGILTPRDIDAFGGSHGVMIGRGMLARPSLAAEWRQDEEWTRERRMTQLMDFHARLFAEYQKTLCGPTQILQKIKPFWDYLEPEIGHHAIKALRKATTLERYQTAVASIE